MRQRYAFLTHKGCAVYALHFNASMDLKPFMRQARYAASQCYLIFSVLSKCGFHLHHCQSHPQSFLFNNLFLWRNDGKLDINVYIIAREHLFHLCKIGRAPYGVRLISYKSGWALYEFVRCPAGHRPMLSYTDAGRRPYDM